MRLVYIYTALTSMGGVDRILSVKANYFAEKCGYEVYIITDSQAGRPPVFPLSPKVKHIDLETDFDVQYHHGIGLRAYYYFTLMHQYRIRMSQVLMDIHADIVITMLGRDMDFLTRIEDGSIKIGESHIAKPFIRNFHLMERRNFFYGKIARHWRKKQERAVRELDALIVLTQHDAESWQEVRNAIVIPNSCTFHSQTTSDYSSRRVISVGRLEEQKGYDLLISAWKLVAKVHPDWHLDIYGEGQLKKSLEKQIINDHLTLSVHLCGVCSEIDVKYAESAFYVMSSRFEGFGLVLIEAMSCGLPCISFDCPFGPEEIIRHKEDGLLVENGNITELAHAICYMIEHDEERKRMGQMALENSKKFHPDAIMERWTDLFNRLIVQKRI